MKTLTYSQTIDAPREVVFDLLQDEDKIRLWMEGVEHTIFEHEDKGVGVQFQQHIREGRHLHAYRGEITKYSPPSTYHLTLGNEAFTMQICYDLDATDEGCVLNYTATMQEANWFVDLMAALFKGLTRRLLERHMANLKQLAETGDADSIPAWSRS